MAAIDVDLTEYQADQLRRLCEFTERYGRSMCIDGAVRKYQSPTPPVWRELADLGLVRIDVTDGGIYVQPVSEEGSSDDN